MFEYADPADIIGLVLMPIASLMLFIKEGRENLTHNTNKKAGRIIVVALLIGTLISALYSSHSNKTLIDTNIQAFKKDQIASFVI